MKHLLATVSYLPFFAPDGGGDGGGAAPAPAAPAAAPSAGGTPPAAGSEGGAAGAAAAGAEPPAGGAAPAAPASILSDAKPADGAAAEADPAAQETPEQKAEREAEEAKKAEEAKAAERGEALKSYDALRLPEGMPADQPAFVDFKNVAADLKLPPDAAQRLIDTVGPRLQEAVNKPYEQWADMLKAWSEACPVDPEYGGKDYEANLGRAAAAINRVMGADAGKFREMLAFTGVGNNPEFIRSWVRIGRLIGEGSPAPGRAATAGDKSLAEKMYGNTMGSAQA